MKIFDHVLTILNDDHKIVCQMVSNTIIMSSDFEMWTLSNNCAVLAAAFKVLYENKVAGEYHDDGTLFTFDSINDAITVFALLHLAYKR